jgi:hypothetical protein
MVVRVLPNHVLQCLQHFGQFSGRTWWLYAVTYQASFPGYDEECQPEPRDRNGRRLLVFSQRE